MQVQRKKIQKLDKNDENGNAKTMQTIIQEKKIDYEINK